MFGRQVGSGVDIAESGCMLGGSGKEPQALAVGADGSIPSVNCAVPFG